ncbi:MAG: 1-(5-phosphoribosyl)-5-[(5-phosphoribosylamino)methylideneamino]imidazole-4-carboxamide isomerase [Candidatus Bathyarchaeia archaeon]
MEVWAAIDLLRGRVVSLRKGNPTDRTEWRGDALAFAKRWQTEGATGLHIVDLDGAFQTGSNRDTVESIVRVASIPVQVGGGIRTLMDAKRWLELGVQRVILGTLAYSLPSSIISIIDEFGSDRVVVALDYKEGRVVTQGWTKTENLELTEAITRLQTAHVETLLATAVQFDGTGAGPDWKTLETLRDLTTMHILASGGVRTADDVIGLRRIGMHGVILGRALYDGTLNLTALKVQE